MLQSIEEIKEEKQKSIIFVTLKYFLAFIFIEKPIDAVKRLLSYPIRAGLPQEMEEFSFKKFYATSHSFKMF